MQFTWNILLICMIFFSNNLSAATPATSSVKTDLVDIGDGRKMFLECSGNGLPTVVFVSGRSDGAEVWNMTTASSKGKPGVFSEVAKFTRVCAYDRPGTFIINEQDVVLPSKSTSVKQPTSPKNGVEDLHALLTAAKVPGPYVLVGHSYGGLIVRLYASTYPNEVSGLVLIDTLTEFLYDSFTPEQQSLWISLNSNYSKEIDQYTVQEKTDFLPTFEQLRAAPAAHSMPVIVLTSDQTFNFKALINQGILPANTPLEFETIVFQNHLRAQKHLAALFHAKQITNTHAGHYIHTEQPQMVVEAIRTVVEEVRTKDTQSQ